MTQTTETLDAARERLTRAGYTVHDREPGLWIPDLAPDSDGRSTAPGSPWDDECDALIADVRSVLDGVGQLRVEWDGDDVHIDPA